jgi:hypothetical protein
MKRVLSLTIAIALTLVCDRAFNHGDLTLKLYDNAADAKNWATRSGNEIAETFTGFRGS